MIKVMWNEWKLNNMMHIIKVLLRLKDVLFPKPISIPQVCDSIRHVPFQKALLVFADRSLE